VLGQLLITVNSKLEFDVNQSGVNAIVHHAIVSGDFVLRRRGDVIQLLTPFEAAGEDEGLNSGTTAAS
jgi:hypothetical protein